MDAKIYNQKGEETGKIELADNIFNIKINLDLLYQVVVAMMSNKRRVLAHVKGRREIRGGGRKPWRQKGTGRARHGSIRSPLWRGGAKTFGPTKERNFKKKINKKVKRKALLMALSSRAAEKEILILDELKLTKPKTKLVVSVLNALLKPKNKKYNSLILIPKKDENILRAAKNIPKVKVLKADNLNVLDLLSYKHLIASKEAIEVIEKTYKK